MFVRDEIQTETVESKRQLFLPKGSIGSFDSFLRERARYKAGLPPLPAYWVPQPEQSRFSQGVPLLTEEMLLQLTESWEIPSHYLILAMQNDFPRVREDLRLMEVSLQDGSLAPKHCMEVMLRGNDKERAEMALHLGMDSRSLEFILGQFLKACMEKRVQTFKPVIESMCWRKGYCPLCGSMAELSYTDNPAGDRWLMCALCGHRWQFKRITCSFCGNADRRQMEYVFIQGRDHEQAELCHECGRYLLCLSRGKHSGGDTVGTDSMGLAHLDLIAQAMGFLPVATHAWSGPAGGADAVVSVSTAVLKWRGGLQ